MKQTKKGFTLVELLVVIAILAILATVSVVGYTTFIEKANRSVDEQAVAQINTALMAANIPEGSVTNIAQVQALMDECNLEIEDYKPLSKDKFFFYDSKLNRVIYTNNTDYQVLYPQELADKTDRANW
ncbi:MAG: prepilin-type N-terminal cleavage/methylation domain-containing protein, partial [Clostridia bacterium]|nr:prepilin-type N-terminal cleavage/methylation domain-containing protein [Clostridia bacterium]